MDLPIRTKMIDVKPVVTPFPTSSSLTFHSGSALTDRTENRAVVGSLRYLSLTRPDIDFAVNKISQLIYQPTTDHWATMKHLSCYLCGTSDCGSFSITCRLCQYMLAQMQIGLATRMIHFHQCLHCLSWPQSHLLEFKEATSCCSLIYKG